MVGYGPVRAYGLSNNGPHIFILCRVLCCKCGLCVHSTFRSFAANGPLIDRKQNTRGTAVRLNACCDRCSFSLFFFVVAVVVDFSVIVCVCVFFFPIICIANIALLVYNILLGLFTLGKVQHF